MNISSFHLSEYKNTINLLPAC